MGIPLKMIISFFFHLQLQLLFIIYRTIPKLHSTSSFKITRQPPLHTFKTNNLITTCDTINLLHIQQTHQLHSNLDPGKVN